MADTKTYIQGEVGVYIGGVIAENFTKVSITRENDTFAFAEGSAGKVARSKNGTKLGSIKVSFLQTEPVNGDLSAYHDGDALLEVEVVDGNGSSLHIMPEGTIVRVPEKMYDKEITELEWEIKGAIPVHFNGAND